MKPPTAVTYTNYMPAAKGAERFELQTWDCPKDAQFCHNFHDIEVEMRWNGYPVRPPVGIRADQCSHEWARGVMFSGPYAEAIDYMELVPRL